VPAGGWETILEVSLLRKLRYAVPLAMVAGMLLAAAPARADSGGCQLQGTATFSPGLSNTAGPFTYGFKGTLSGCQSTAAAAPAAGTVEAGQVYTDPVTLERFQEPAATGSGTCANGTTSGTAIITWADATRTVIAYSTTAVGAAVHLSGSVVSGVTLPAINPAPGQPTSTTLTTTRYAGAQALGVLAFQADPTPCAGAGVTTAGIIGATALTT
jgi:hypothetical protein